MKILERVKVPTGDILTVLGDRNKPLELLSIGDYGKDVNLKCDAMGLSRVPEQVQHTTMLPLEDKWVITISSQYGCSMGCNFCDVPKVGPGYNASFDDILDQIYIGIDLHPEVLSTKRLNIHYARMGEPTWNPSVLEATRELYYTLDDVRFPVIHPVVSTMMPKGNKWLLAFLRDWMRLKNDMYEGDAGLQLSINSTDEDERTEMFGGSSLALSEIYQITKLLPRPIGRKITLNFAVADYTIDPSVLLRYFLPSNFIIKLTPMHKTATALANGIKTDGDYTTYYPYEKHEEQLKAAGYDVLVFIASKEEDESRITCGNAILATGVLT